ncbi:hypothetical protein LLS1_27370 [Leifsonia sp. LS1]|uniref:hypothetical protein n=1 Tax=Leifsonia sp. LS1 TaxID=2828483 RepID=UPI001CFD1E4F|nr:hypothetical protein [Leifsonia sp. LS1]GIT81068.1 hypothetical protein LLS1_27370 [Leifsonia sp. LS1]
MPDSNSRPPALIALAVILFLEAALVTGLAGWLLVELLTVTPESFATAIAIFILTLLGAIWVIVTAAGILRKRGWARASTVTIQILQIAVAVGCFQGLVARPDLGWALLIPALVAGVLALTPSVVRATVRNTEQHD